MTRLRPTSCGVVRRPGRTPRRSRRRVRSLRRVRARRHRVSCCMSASASSASRTTMRNVTGSTRSMSPITSGQSRESGDLLVGVACWRTSTSITSPSNAARRRFCGVSNINSSPSDRSPTMSQYDASPTYCVVTSSVRPSPRAPGTGSRTSPAGSGRCRPSARRGTGRSGRGRTWPPGRGGAASRRTCRAPASCGRR